MSSGRSVLRYDTNGTMTGVLRPTNDLQRVRENTMGQVLPLIVAAVAIALLTPAGAQDKPEMPKLRLAVGGKSAIFYLPLSITERLGYFRDAGLDVVIADVQTGAPALHSPLRGTSAIRVGTFDHTIQM